MTPVKGSGDSLNPSQLRHLRTTCEYADRLLREIESILSVSDCKSTFPSYKEDISPAQARVVHHYIGRIRAHMLRVLESHGILPPVPQTGAAHAIRVTVSFADVAFEECRPQYMRGYGEVPESAIPELNGLVDEIQGLLSKLDAFLAQGPGWDLAQRLKDLELTGDVTQVKVVEDIISRHGLVEFRHLLSGIVDRLEGEPFEIAFFGKVSSGKSSLLNAIVQSQVLPVGVTPITSVPTRLTYGVRPKGNVWFAGFSGEEVAIEELAEYVTEQQNPGNFKSVTRVVVELPSPRLRQGIVLVDTPGVGSVAGSLAVETISYLPRCDLGCVLVDASSALSPEDLEIVRILYGAGIPASVVLSKADLLTPREQNQSRQYVADQVSSQLGVELPVQIVSVREGYAALIADWFEREILPVYDRHMEMSKQALRRKIGALTENIRVALQSRLDHSGQARELQTSRMRKAEADLHQTAGRFSEIRARCEDLAGEIGGRGESALREAAVLLVERCLGRQWQQEAAHGLFVQVLQRHALERCSIIMNILRAFAGETDTVLGEAAVALRLGQTPGDAEIAGVLKEMPTLDVGGFKLEVRPNNFLLRLGKALARRSLERKLRRQVGEQVALAFSVHGRIVKNWSVEKLGEMKRRFDSYADTYCALFARFSGAEPRNGSARETIHRDLEMLSGSRPHGEAPEVRDPTRKEA